MSGPAARADRSGFLGWRMVALGFLAVNLAIGSTFGGFGVLVKPVAGELGAGRGLASLGIAIVLVLMGVAGPVLGVALRRVRIRSVMIAGALLMAAGFLLAARATTFAGFLAAYSLLGGAGCALLGIIPASTLVTHWFVERRGLALGLISVPLVVAAAPPVLAWLIEQHGWRAALQAQAALLLVVVPLLRWVVDRPEDVGQSPLGGTGAMDGPPVADTPAPSNAALLRDRYFLGAVLCCGLITPGGIIIVSHLVPWATDLGMQATAAATLLSVNGSASMAGALLWGWIADRIGARIGVGLLGLALAVLWSLLLAFPVFPLVYLLLLGIGLCSGGLHPAFAALLGAAFGRGAFASALGLATLLMLPFTFAAAPLAGAVFDLTGSYRLAFIGQIACFGCAAAVLLLAFRARPR